MEYVPTTVLAIVISTARATVLVCDDIGAVGITVVSCRNAVISQHIYIKKDDIDVIFVTFYISFAGISSL